MSGDTPLADPSLTGRLATGVNLLDVRLVETKARALVGPSFGPPAAMQLRMQHKAYLVDAPDAERRFQVRAGLRVSLVEPQLDGPPMVYVGGFFELTYEHAAEATPSEDDLNEFARVNGVFDAWPYFRELVQTTFAKMGFPPLTLPIYQQRQDHRGTKTDPEKASDL